jgi:hypothetical protein
MTVQKTFNIIDRPTFHGFAHGSILLQLRQQTGSSPAVRQGPKPL